MRLYVRNGKIKIAKSCKTYKTPMALRKIYQAPIIWVAEWSPIVQGRPKNTIYQDYLRMRLKHDAQIENKVPLNSRSQGLNLCLLAEGAYFISTVAQTGHAFS